MVVARARRGGYGTRRPTWLTSLVMTALVVSTCIRTDHWLAPLTGHPWLRYVGMISYGVYLMHMIVLNLVRRAVPGQGCRRHFVLTLARERWWRPR